MKNSARLHCVPEGVVAISDERWGCFMVSHLLNKSASWEAERVLSLPNV